MTVKTRTPPIQPTASGDPFVLAWIGVALIPLFFIAGFAVGEVVYAALGYRPENDDAPLWVDLIASVAAVGIALAPCVTSVAFGRRAAVAGRRAAAVPTAIAALVGAALVIMTALSI